MLHRFGLGYTFLIRLADLLVVLLALVLSSRLRTTLNIGALGGTETAFETPPALYILAPALWLIAFQFAGVYLPSESAWLWREIQRVVIGHALACLLFFGVLYLLYRDYSRLQSLYFLTLTLLGLGAYRIVLRIAYRLTGRRVLRSRAVLIVGTDENAQRIGKTVNLYAWAGLYLVGYLKHHPDDKIAEEIAQCVLGIVDDLPLMVAKHRIDEVIFALKSPDYAYLSRMIQALQYQVTNIRLAPDYSDLAYFHVSVENFGGIPLLGLREAVLSPSQRLVKRLFDLTLATLGLVFGLPLLIVIAIAIKLESPGPILYPQKRIGEHGRPFLMLKFRSMVANADKLQDKSSVDHKKREDPRVTRVGRFLRRTSLDELPQLLNILRGDMSVVGPRPEMPWLVSKYEPWQRKRFEVPQGLTGWWQINGRADKPMYLHTEDDLFYIRNYSLWLDIQIIIRTVLIIFTGRGAY
jgi:exopolysaccharide biosynthesis polyprenyl glycosylphosphotransferase